MGLDLKNNNCEFGFWVYRFFLFFFFGVILFTLCGSLWTAWWTRSKPKYKTTHINQSSNLTCTDGQTHIHSLKPPIVLGVILDLISMICVHLFGFVMVYCICGRLVNINVGSGGKDIHHVFGTNWAGVGCVGELVRDDGELFVEIIKELYCLVKKRCPVNSKLDIRRKMGEGVRKSSGSRMFFFLIIKCWNGWDPPYIVFIFLEIGRENGIWFLFFIG